MEPPVSSSTSRPHKCYEPLLYRSATRYVGKLCRLFLSFLEHAYYAILGDFNLDPGNEGTPYPNFI